MANEAVFKYLSETNRPYSCNDVTVNLRGAYSKGVVQKAMDALSESGKIRCKVYGKQKVYAAIQSDAETGDNDIEDYDSLFKNLTENLSNNANGLKVAENKLKTLTAAPTTESAKTQIEQIKNTITNYEDKLATLKNSTDILDPEEKRKIMGEHDKFLREYRKRKRVCSDMLDAVLEGHPKPKKVLMEELCIETDEMVNFKITTS